MKNKLLSFCMLMILIVALCGCSNQHDVSKTDEKSEMTLKDEDTLEDESDVTEEILAEDIDLSSYAQIPDNAIQEFWSWSEGGARVGYDPDGGYSYWKVTKELLEEYIMFTTGVLLMERGVLL